MLPNGRQESKPGPTAQPSYDPENLGAWNGQLPNTDLVDQLPPADTVHPLPDLDNTVKTLFYWAMDLDIPHGPRLALLTILRHIDWKEGSDAGLEWTCWPMIPECLRGQNYAVGMASSFGLKDLITRHGPHDPGSTVCNTP